MPPPGFAEQLRLTMLTDDDPILIFEFPFDERAQFGADPERGLLHARSAGGAPHRGWSAPHRG